VRRRGVACSALFGKSLARTRAWPSMARGPWAAAISSRVALCR
jgi:hypothetical protein